MTAQEILGHISRSIIKLVPINPLLLIILGWPSARWQYSFIDFHSQGADVRASVSMFSLVAVSPSPCLCLPLFPLPVPLSFWVRRSPARWWYSFLPKCQMFLDRNKLHFFMAYGKLPWLLLLLYPLCELNMYSVACCLQCYCRVTYGTDSIRMKLALDNPSDYMRPGRGLLGLPSAPRSPVRAAAGLH